MSHVCPLVILGAVVATAETDARADPVAHVENTFELTVAAPYDRVAPLFGAWAERAWAGAEWQPEFLYPLPPRDEPGEVFLVTHGPHRAIWVNTAFDLKSGIIQYVYVIPNVLVTVIDIHVERAGPSSTHARVTYRRTALDPKENPHVTELGAHDRGAGKGWETAIAAAAVTSGGR